VEVNSRLDSCRKLSRFMRLNFVHDDPELLLRMLHPDRTELFGYDIPHPEELMSNTEEDVASDAEEGRAMRKTHQPTATR
jgi:hypothetical protein